MPGDSRGNSPHTGDTQCPNTHTTTQVIERTSDYSGSRGSLVRGTHQEVAHTQSRRSGPRKWLRAVEWLIAAGLHGRANATTLRVAEDLAQRMDYTTGHVRYGLKDMVTRLGIPRSTLAKHIAYLRELGALAWVEHGSRMNRLAAMGLTGYQGTATVYAAVIPPVYDHAMGHTIVGSGYTARIVIDQRGQTPTGPRKPVDNPPVDNSTSEARETPSLTCVEEEGKLKMVGGSNYTSQARPSKPRIPHQSSSINGRPRTGLDVQKASRTTRLVRALVPWTQTVALRPLEYVLRPWTDCGQDAYQISADLNGMCSGMRWRPTNPLAFIRARLTADRERQQQIHTEQAAAARWEQENPLEGAFQGSYSTFLDITALNRQGQQRLQADSRARGWDDLSGADDTAWDAEADVLAFLNGSPA